MTLLFPIMQRLENMSILLLCTAGHFRCIIGNHLLGEVYLDHCLYDLRNTFLNGGDNFCYQCS